MPTDSESTKKAVERKSAGGASKSKSGEDETRNKRRPAEEPIDDPEDEEEEDEGEEDEPPRVRNRSNSAPVSKKAVPKTEEALDTPNAQTLWMLGVVSACTLVMWGFGRAACNLHPPRESRKPRTVSVQDLARDPKNAAIELQQRWAVHRYGNAMDLASGPVADELRKKAMECEARTEACQKEQAQLADQVKTIGDLLRRDMTTAIVRVKSYGPGSAEEKYLVTLESAGTIWKAKSREKDIGQPLPASPPPTPAEPAPIQVMPPGNAPAMMVPTPGAPPAPPAQGERPTP